MFVVVGSATSTCINIWSDPNVLDCFVCMALSCTKKLTLI